MSINIELTAECAARVRWPTSEPTRFLAAKLELVKRITDASLPGVLDVVLGTESVLVSFDPTELNFEHLKSILYKFVQDAKSELPVAGRLIEIPVCYDPEFGMDLEVLSQQVSLNADEMIELHLSGTYSVTMIGFSPGFPYLSGLAKELHVPRKATPRTLVPAGSVGIGGSQTGIYSIASPGGWHIIGRTPVALFMPDRFPPTLLQPGDQVRFFRISANEFHAWTNPP